jgi:hypothetical protein
MPKAKRNRPGAFRKGYDPRRHKFTTEECQLGYENAILKLCDKYPDARCRHGAHISHCLLRVKNPLWFEVRKLEVRVASIEARMGKQDAKVRGLKRELRKLKNEKGYTLKPRNRKEGST